MKKNLIFLAGMAVLISAVSCSIEENKIDPIPADPRVPMTFTAGEFTKTSLVPGDNENAVHWSAGDAISIFDGTNNNEFTLTEGAGTASAKFEGEAVPDKTYYALYPYSASAEFNGTVITSSLPAEQQYVGATFDTMLNPSVAVADENNNLAFHNVASILQINVSGLQSKSVREIQISADKSLTGEYTVDMSGDAFSAAASGTEISGLRLLVDSADMETDPNFNGSISCYAVVLPGTYANLKISVIYSDNSYSEKSFENVTLVASDGNYVNVDASQATPNDDGLYGLFMAGQDIYIGGTAYNKSQFTTDQIKYLTGENNISSSNKGQILFIDSEATIGTFSNQSNLIVIGNSPDIKPTLPVKASILLAPIQGEESRLVLSNLNIEPDASFKNYMFGVNGNYSETGAFGEFILDNCDITLTTAAFYSISNARYLDKFVMQNCYVKVPENSGNRFILHMAAYENHYSEIRFVNNIFNTSGAGTLSFRLVSGAVDNNKTIVDELVVENNTFVNVAHTNSAMLIASEYGDVHITKNLIYIQQSNIPTNQTNMNMLRAITNPDGYPDAPYCVDNIVYQDVNVDGIQYNMFFNFTYSPASGELDNLQVLENSPFEGGDLSTFTPAPEYASYGAQR